jgi:glycosyltransferase involved in cell wall biosynthesis
MDRYTVVVPAYNEERYLPRTLAAIRAAMAQVPEAEGTLIVVDNGSTDRTAELAATAGAQVILEPHRQIARVRNTGGRRASTPFLIFVDADTWISPALLRETLAALHSGRVCGGGTICRFDSAPRWARAMMQGWNAFSRGVGWAAGSYFFCLREGLLATGGFDETVYASEELGFSRVLKRWGRARGMKFRILREPVVTSSRKLEWFGTAQLLGWMLRFLLNPLAARKRENCALWYTRPDAPAGKGESAP